METHIYGAVAPTIYGKQPKFRNKLPFEVRILGNNRAQSEAVERAICDASKTYLILTRLAQGSG